MSVVDYEKGTLYRIRCQNLEMGVFNGDGGFIGIREKFGTRFLATEYLTPGPLGTVTSVGAKLGQTDLALVETLGISCTVCDQPVKWSEQVASAATPRGAWVHVSESDHDAKPIRIDNRALFDWINSYVKREER